MKDAIRFTQEQLEPVLNQALEIEHEESDFVRSYVSGVARSLISNPAIYRSFGAYWWPLKELMIELGITVFGDNLEAGTLSAFKMESEELVCCAAYVQQQESANNNRLLSTEHLIELAEGETREYMIFDGKMEELSILHEMRKKPKTMH